MSSEVHLQEFLAEAEELVEQLNHGLLELDEKARAGKKADPSVVNSIFRAAHSLKGISGMFGFKEVGELAHRMEDILDRLRMGRLQLTAKALDILFEATEKLRDFISIKAEGGKVPEADLERIKKMLDNIEVDKEEEDKARWLNQSGVSEDVLAVLTEYEEHRLIENIKEGQDIYQIKACFDLATFDKELHNLQSRLKEFGEIITTLPSPESSSEEKIVFYLLLGANPSVELDSALSDLPLELKKLTAKETPPKPQAIKKEEEKEQKSFEPETIAEQSEPSEEPSVRSLSRTVRVDIGKLDNLMNIVGELVLSKNIIGRLVEKIREQMGFGELAVELYKANKGLERKLSELQEGVLEVRMVSIGQIYEKLRRNVRKLSRETQKEVEFITEGGDTELDKLIIEDLADPLMHIIRNAIDHGIEPRSERVRLGKPEVGLIKLVAFQRGNNVVIEISDDGRGLDYAKIRKKAIELGWLDKDVEPKEEELIQFLFKPGFSTSEKVSEISGRGVGLDVVKNNIAELSGVIDITSNVGEGTKVTITLPITLAIIQSLVIESGGETFAIPLNSVSSGLLIRTDEIKTIEGREVIELREQTLPLLRLDRFFGLKGSTARPNQNELYVVTVGIAEKRLGIVVDRLIGRQDIVIKPIGEVLGNIRGIAGATELGDQRAILVLDVVGLLEEVSSVHLVSLAQAGAGNVS